MWSPDENITARSSTFSSSRTLPGQEYCWRISIDSGDRAPVGIPCREASSARYFVASTGTSSIRSRSGIVRMATTFRR
jgi:hypothetical protein